MSVLIQAEIVNAVVLAAVLQADLGSHRAISKHRIIRPILLAAAIVPLFIEKIATTGTGLTVEIAGAAAGIVAGLIAIVLTRVYRSPSTGKAVSATGWPYAALWAFVIGARAAFSYGSTHWFGGQLLSWMTTNNVTPAAITDGLIFMAVAMLVFRTLGLARRAHAINRSTVGSERFGDASSTVAVGASAAHTH